MASESGLYNGYRMDSEVIMLCPPEREANQKNLQIVEPGRTEGQQSAMEATRSGHNATQYMQKNVLGNQNTVTTCQFCHAHVNTSIKHTVTTRTHITAALCCMVFCCCCLPYCMDSAKNTDHYCPACQRYLGTYEK